jgi:hypothetical protein
VLERRARHRAILTEALFDKLRAAVAAGIAAGQTLEQMQRNIKMAEYSQGDGFDWVPLNVLGMYHFLTDSR